MRRLDSNPEIVALDVAGTFPYHIVGRIIVIRNYEYYDDDYHLVRCASAQANIQNCIICGLTAAKEEKCFGWFNIGKTLDSIMEKRENGHTNSL